MDKPHDLRQVHGSDLAALRQALISNHVTISEVTLPECLSTKTVDAEDDDDREVQDWSVSVLLTLLRHLVLLGYKPPKVDNKPEAFPVTCAMRDFGHFKDADKIWAGQLLSWLHPQMQMVELFYQNSFHIVDTITTPRVQQALFDSPQFHPLAFSPKCGVQLPFATSASCSADPPLLQGLEGDVTPGLTSTSTSVDAAPLFMHILYEPPAGCAVSDRQELIRLKVKPNGVGTSATHARLPEYAYSLVAIVTQAGQVPSIAIFNLHGQAMLSRKGMASRTSGSIVPPIFSDWNVQAGQKHLLFYSRCNIPSDPPTSEANTSTSPASPSTTVHRGFDLEKHQDEDEYDRAPKPSTLDRTSMSTASSSTGPSPSLLPTESNSSAVQARTDCGDNTSASSKASPELPPANEAVAQDRTVADTTKPQETQATEPQTPSRANKRRRNNAGDEQPPVERKKRRPIHSAPRRSVANLGLKGDGGESSSNTVKHNGQTNPEGSKRHPLGRSSQEVTNQTVGTSESH